MTRRDRIIRLAKLRGDKAALAIMERAQHKMWRCSICGVPQDAEQDYCHEASPYLVESELRALWGDR